MQTMNLVNNPNPLIIGSVVMYLVGITTFLARRLPMQLWRFIKARFTVSIRLENGESNERRYIAELFFYWYNKNGFIKTSRRFILNSVSTKFYAHREKISTEKSFLSPGLGLHFFKFNNRWAWFNRSISSSGEDIIELTFIGTSFSIIDNFIKEIQPKKLINYIKVYTISTTGGSIGWEVLTDKPMRDITSVVIDDNIVQKIIEDIHYFYNNKEWYSKRFLNHKISYLLHGLPGTGKSSLIFALASYFNKNIYLANMSLLTDENFQQIIDSVKPNAFIVFEDIDVCTASVTRNEVTNTVVQPVISINKLSLSTILNTLDGIASLENNVVFMTTNYLQRLDSALIRKGRIDHIVEIPVMSDTEIRKYINIIYPSAIIPENIKFTPIAGADIQGYFLDNKNDFNSFIKELTAE